MIRTETKATIERTHIVFWGLILAATTVLVSFGLAGDETDARRFAAHALSLRASGVASDAVATTILAYMPGAGMVTEGGAEDALPFLWRPFFENAMVKLGRLHSSAPVAFYYNPLLDVALFTLWEKRGKQYRVASIRALPGERLTEPDIDVSPRPPWMTAAEGPVETLALTAFTRLGAFRHAHPAEEQVGGRDDTTFASAAADLRAGLPRLVWNAAMRARWTRETEPWLALVLSEIEAALTARKVEALVAAAPNTDAETAATLTRLPISFTERLTLDMVLGDAENETERLLIGSLPEDGDVYLLASCRLDRDKCVLRRFVLLSLLE